ncbi:MAG: polar amino acid transport system substrate-binding protein [Mycobacterium sp.]|nr:polar amino acid transport system substrate-binding protein [Mycobacterium sp.]
MRISRGWRVAVVVSMWAALPLTGCSTKGYDGPPCDPAAKPAKVDDVANLLPDDIKQSGKLIVGVDPSYRPNEWKDNNKIVGFDVDLLNAVAAPLGVTLDCRESKFDNIIPSIGTTYTMGMSSFTDTKERQNQVDFVDYFTTSTLWAQHPGAPIDPNNPCGKRVAVQSATIQETELNTKNDACLKQNQPKIEILKFDLQDAATNALTVGQADAMTADYPVTVDAIKNSGGKLEAAGEQFGNAPYGWAIPKGSKLGPALVKSLEHIMQTGEYQKILAKWNVDKGAIPKPTINGAVS